MGIYMTRREIIQLPSNQGWVIGANIMNAYNSGCNLIETFDILGIEFVELFDSDNVIVVNDSTNEGVEEVVLHNNKNSLMYVYTNGIIKITFKNRDAIKRYYGNGIFEILTRRGSDRHNRRLKVDTNTMEPYFMNGGECR